MIHPLIAAFALAATLSGVVNDPTGLALPGAAVELFDETTGRVVMATTDAGGTFAFSHVPAGRYRLRIAFPGFDPHESSHTLVADRPEHVRVLLTLPAFREQVSVQAPGIDLPLTTTMQSTIDRGLLETLPSESVSGGLSAVLTLASPGVAADSNGGFHPLGEHAET